MRIFNTEPKISWNRCLSLLLTFSFTVSLSIFSVTFQLQSLNIKFTCNSSFYSINFVFPKEEIPQINFSSLAKTKYKDIIFDDSDSFTYLMNDTSKNPLVSIKEYPQHWICSYPFTEIRECYYFNYQKNSYIMINPWHGINSHHQYGNIDVLRPNSFPHKKLTITAGYRYVLAPVCLWQQYAKPPSTIF